MKLLQVNSVEEVKQKLQLNFTDLTLSVEQMRIDDALGRTAAEDIYCGIAMPEFERSTVDGYAVFSKDTFGASESLPVFLDVIGKVEMGKATDLPISAGKAVYVPTGGMIPKGADGMVMIEYVEELDELTIAVHDSIAPGDNIIFVGDDIKAGELLLKKGEVIRPQHIGTLTAAGIETAAVFAKPRMAIVSTGDEITDPFGDVSLGQVRDINAYVLAAMASDMGAEVTYKGIVEDELDLLVNTIGKLKESNDIVIISGGSSAGNKDVTAKAIDILGNPGVFVHGIAVKPGKPTIIGKSDNKAIIGLPGHPVSAAIVFRVFVGFLLDMLNHRSSKKLFIHAACSSNVHSSPGKETYQMVDIIEENGCYTAVPVYAKSAAISLLSKAKGIVTIPMNTEGIRKGETVRVELL